MALGGRHSEYDGEVTDQFDPPRPWIRSYAETVPHDLPEMSGSLMDLVADSAREYPTAPALQFFGAVTSYASLAEQIDRAAATLRAEGVRKGDPVALVLPNCPQHIVAFYAILRLGAVVVEHNPLYTPRELRKQFADHGAKHAIVWSNVVGTIQEFPVDLAVSTIISVDLTRAMPAYMRWALRLPLPKLRAQRAQLTTRVRGAIPSRPTRCRRMFPGPRPMTWPSSSTRAARRAIPRERRSHTAICWRMQRRRAPGRRRCPAARAPSSTPCCRCSTRTA